MKKIKFIRALVIGLILLSGSTAYAQEKAANSTESAEADKAKAAITEKVAEIEKLLNESDFAGIAGHLSEEAQDEVAVGVVTDAVASIHIGKQLKDQLGAMADQLNIGSTEDLEKLLKKHKLDDLGMESGFKMMVGGPGGDTPDLTKAKLEEAEAGKKQMHDKILEALGEGDSRWKLISEITKETNSPFKMSGIIAGKVSKIELAENHKSAKVTIKEAAKDPLEGGGMQMMIGGPENVAVINLALEDGKWIHNGTDMEATSELRMEAMKNMPTFGGGHSKSDF